MAHGHMAVSRRKLWRLLRVDIGQGSGRLKPQPLSTLKSEADVQVWLDAQIARLRAAGYPAAALTCTDLTLHAKAASGSVVFTATTKVGKAKVSH